MIIFNKNMLKYFLINNIMKNKINLIIFFVFIFSSVVIAKENFYDDAIDLFEKKKYEDSKFLFQRNIVFNPKDSKSYLYLAKIYKFEEDEKELEKNLNTTLLLDPINEEAIYMLIDVELGRSNFSKAKELTSKFGDICSKLCEKKKSINERLKNFQEQSD